ncbi:hypothetical protein BH11PLA2_BH11PLA2_38570 [soil metagenome]
MTTTHMNQHSVDLTDATVQEIQLELIRRRRFNQFDGQKTHDFLMKHRDLWIGVTMDRFGYISEKADAAAHWGLIKLRDLPGNRWNVDTLVVMTATRDQAHQLAKLIEESDLEADTVEVESEANTGMALGSSPTNRGLVSAWWD